MAQQLKGLLPSLRTCVPSPYDRKELTLKSAVTSTNVHKYTHVEQLNVTFKEMNRKILKLRLGRWLSRPNAGCVTLMT